MNTVTGPFTAIVNGNHTGLAGCDREDCELPCLRKDAVLAKRNSPGYMYSGGSREPIPFGDCRSFIPNGS